MTVRVVVFGNEPGSRYRALRTVRTLRRHVPDVQDLSGQSPLYLGHWLRENADPVWLVRAGCWPIAREATQYPNESATGLPLLALGAIHTDADSASITDAELWRQALQMTGGDFESGGDLPPCASMYLAGSLVSLLAHNLVEENCIAQALARLWNSGLARRVHASQLDVRIDERLRVLQVVTSMQRGGAERVTLDLATELPRLGVCCGLVTLGRPTRAAFPIPPGTLDLSRLAGNRTARADTLTKVANAWGADLIHAHLVDGADLALWSEAGLPVMATVHNLRPGWPEGLDHLQSGQVLLLAACAQAVEADLRAASLPVPIRTVWNGINAGPMTRTTKATERGLELKRQLGIPLHDFVMLSMANPRPQKRLHLLPEIMIATQKELERQEKSSAVHLLMAGQASRASSDAKLEMQRFQDEVKRLGLESQVHFLGCVEDEEPVFGAADVLVSTSAFEGLSLAQMEAVAREVAVVATDVGGAAELALESSAIQLVPLDAKPVEYAQSIAELGRIPRSWGPRFRDFTRDTMAARYRWLYPRAIEAARPCRRGNGLWLIANNFSTGGAQSSARRLLLGLAARGVRVRAAVLEEQVEYPTPGRRALVEAGVPVIALPPPNKIDPAQAVARLLERLDEDRPQAVLFWNVMPPYKILLADALLDVPIFDVSPGEMYYQSLERYFAKPRPGLTYRTGRDYGRRLAGAIVKYEGEAAQAAEYLGCPVHVVPNGVALIDKPPQAVGSANGARDKRLILGTLARISPQKRLEELLDALRLASPQLPPHLLRIGGSPERDAEPYFQELRKHADGLSVQWVGEIEDQAAFLHGLDIFVLVAEPAGCPNASLEAMAVGLPVIATTVGGMAEQIEDEVSGILVPRGDSGVLAEAMVRLAHDTGLRARHGAAARRRIASCFSVERMLDRYVEICLRKI